MKTHKPDQRKRQRLSPAIVEGAKPARAPYRLWDSVVPQLFLRVQPLNKRRVGVKSWNVQWRQSSSRSLGKWPGVTVEMARKRAVAVLNETHEHGKPLAVIEAEKEAKDRPITLSAFVTEHYAPWVRSHQKNGEATVAALKAVFEENLYGRDLRQVSAFDVERVKAARLKAGRKPATVNRDLDRIRSVFSRAVDWAFLPSHPMRTVKRAKGADNSRVRYLTAEEEARLREALTAREGERRERRASGNKWRARRGYGEEHPVWAADAFTDHLMPLVLLAMNTGMRRGELFGIAWDNVNLPRALLTIPAGIAKSRRARHIPLNAEAVDVLARWKAQHGGHKAKGLVFPSAEGGRMNNVNKSWAAVTTAAELPDFRFHDLRHHFASKLVMAGVDLNTVRELLGHADIAMTLRYAHLAPDKLADAVARLGVQAS